MKKRVLRVKDGNLIPIGNNFAYVLGDHPNKTDDVDIGPNNKNGLSVNHGEIMQFNRNGIRVFSAEPILDGISPSQLVQAGINPNTVFAAQERYKDIHHLRDDGRHAELGDWFKGLFGKKEIVTDNAPEYYGGDIEPAIIIASDSSKLNKLAAFYHKHSNIIPKFIHRGIYNAIKESSFQNNPISELKYNLIPNIIHNREAASDDVFLMSKKQQTKELLKAGYSIDTTNNYGLVNAAVKRYINSTGRNVPIYQYGENDIERDSLIPLRHNVLHPHFNLYKKIITKTESGGTDTHFEDLDNLGDKGSAPFRLYRDNQGNLYYKRWDFFDHGNYSRKNYTNEDNEYVVPALTQNSQKYGNILDLAGNPFVKTTGYTKIPKDQLYKAYSVLTNSIILDGDDEENKVINNISKGVYDINNKKLGGETKINNDYATIPLQGNPLYDITGTTKYKSNNLDNPESRKFILDSLWAMENPYGQGLNRDGSYGPYGDPNGSDQDVGPGILLNNLPVKKSYTKQELEDYAYSKVLEGRDKIRQSFDEKYGQGEYDKLDETRKYIMDDVRYRYGTVSQSEWPNLYQAIYDNDVVKALTNARTKFKNKKGEVIGWDNGRIERLAQYFYPDIVVEHKGNKDTYLKVYKKK